MSQPTSHRWAGRGRVDVLRLQLCQQLLALDVGQMASARARARVLIAMGLRDVQAGLRTSLRTELALGRRHTRRAAAMVMALSLASTACGGAGNDAAPPKESAAGATSDDAASAANDGSVDDSIDGAMDSADDTSSGDTASRTSEEDEPPTSEGNESGDAFDPFLGDLPQPCTVISAEEIGAIVGTAVTADETFATDCFYEPTDVAAGGLTVHTSTLSFGDECSEFIQTEQFVPQESVEPAPEYGDLAALITTDGTSQYQVCADGVAFSVAVLGLFEPDGELRAIAAEILDLLMARS